MELGRVLAAVVGTIVVFGIVIAIKGADPVTTYEALFDSIYAGSTVQLELEVARPVAPGSVVAVARSTLDAPTGPMQGVNQARMTMVIVEQAGEWRITAFHNTLVVAGR